MAELRVAFRRQVTAVGDQLVAAADDVSVLLERATQAVLSADPDEAVAIREAGQRIDAVHLEVREAVLRLFALEAPVAADLRVLAATLHANLHLARLAGLTTAVAKQAKRTGDGGDEVLRAQLGDMGRQAAALPTRAFTALARRDAVAARGLAAADEPIDDLNRAVRRRVAGEDHGDARSGVAFVLAARSIERFADHCVAVGEEAIYAATGTWEPLEPPDAPEV